jgi:MarR family transcriptional regulator, lower aerobic nicotinate degradation pathway regulator
MRHRDMYLQPGYLIRRLHQKSTAEFAAATNGLDITQIQFSILLVLQDLPGIDATRISELIRSDRTTIRQALLILEEKELIRRAPGLQDKRTKSLEITGRGAHIADQVSGLVPNLGDMILEGLTRREQQAFMRMLEKLVPAPQDEADDGKALTP